MKKYYTKDEVQAIIDDINAGNFKELPDISGYSSRKVRNLLNRLVGMRHSTIYLEIGVHLGSTFVPAMFENKSAYGIAVDAWNMFGDLHDQFLDNVKANIPGYRYRVNIIHGDFRDGILGAYTEPISVYFYDGDHGMDCQYQALMQTYRILDDQFIFLVDDFNWQEPRDGTRKAIADLNLTVEAEWVLPGPYNGIPPEGGENHQWWNGLFVGIFHK